MLLAFKIFLVPLIILLVSVAGRIWGPKVSGLLTGLPIIAGPILLILYLDNGKQFAEVSAQGTLLGTSSLALFCLSYAWASKELNVVVSLALSLIAFTLCTLVFFNLQISPDFSFISTIAIITSSLLSIPKVEKSTVKNSIPNFEILLRMIAAATLVTIITVLSNFLGPKLSGLLAPFPIAGTVLSTFTHRNYGHLATVNLLKGFLIGLYGMATFSYSLVLLSSHIGFILAFLASATISGVLVKILDSLNLFNK